MVLGPTSSPCSLCPPCSLTFAPASGLYYQRLPLPSCACSVTSRWGSTMRAPEVAELRALNRDLFHENMICVCITCTSRKLNTEFLGKFGPFLIAHLPNHHCQSPRKHHLPVCHLPNVRIRGQQLTQSFQRQEWKDVEHDKSMREGLVCFSFAVTFF